MSEWSDALEALQSDPELTPEQYEEWLGTGNGKFYDFFRAYGKSIGRAEEQERIIKLLEIGGPIEQIICDYWGNPKFDKDDALVLIERAIKGENK
jgi:hypothetical protein